MHELLSNIESPEALHNMSLAELKQLADEIRDVLCNLLGTRSAHFASNLGVVELCLALHSVFDFSHDRLIWDTGHQIYPHKLVTGRYHEFGTIRTKGGLMGYPNPAESPYDLFMTGHAGSSISTLLGLHVGDALSGSPDRHAVAVIGDGAFPSGIVFEAMNNAGAMNQKILMILNDNKMSICPRVGGLASYLDRLRTNPVYTGLKTEVVRALNKMPVLGDPAERFLAQLKEGIKAGLHGGMLFEDLGFRYIGPIDGHNIGLLRKYLQMVKTAERSRAAACGHREGTRFPARCGRSHLFPHAAGLRGGSWQGHSQAVGIHALIYIDHARRDSAADARASASGGDDGGHVPGEYARTDPGRVSRPLL